MRGGLLPSLGSQSALIDKLIADSAADLLRRCALRGAYEDKVFFDADGLQHHAPTRALTLFGAYAPIFQFYAEWIAFSGVTTLRGVNLCWFPLDTPIGQRKFRGRHDDNHRHPASGRRRQTALTSADDTPATESIAPSDPGITFPPILTTNPIVDANGLAGTTDRLAVFDSGGNSVHILEDVRSLLTGGTPSSTENALSLTGTLASFVLHGGIECRWHYRDDFTGTQDQ